MAPKWWPSDVEPFVPRRFMARDEWQALFDYEKRWIQDAWIDFDRAFARYIEDPTQARLAVVWRTLDVIRNEIKRLARRRGERTT